MATLIVFEFPSTGPFGSEAAGAYRDLANDIAEQTGLIWKVWTEDPVRQVAGGVYLFRDSATASDYVAMHTRRLEGFGITDISATTYEVNEELSRADHAVLSRPGN
ncbi:monooxygenase [Corynebacterium halotolerans]|uniref:monooxygenase n=1 Tax=Corynebacterium halotolerans TaxID=225326 RepID=UPI003CEDC3E1